MNLRPHHLLCIQKFTGHGYSADFTAHMTAVVSELAENPETAVTLAKGCGGCQWFSLCRNTEVSHESQNA